MPRCIRDLWHHVICLTCLSALQGLQQAALASFHSSLLVVVLAEFPLWIYGQISPPALFAQNNAISWISTFSTKKEKLVLTVLSSFFAFFCFQGVS